MNENIFITDFSNIKLSDRLMMIRTPKGEIGLDIHFLLNQKSDTEFAYFNATELADMFNVKYRDITRGQNWVQYVQEIELILKEQSCSLRKMDKIYYKEDGTQRAIVSRKGRYGGTYLHHDLAIKFVGLLDVKWEVHLHQFMKNLIKHTNKIKLERTNTKFLFHPLADAIRDIYIPAQKSENAVKFAYSNILDMVNIKALGCRARDYKLDKGITDEQIKEDGNISIRDYMTKQELAKIKKVEQDVWGLMKYANLTSYDEIKNRL